MGDGGGGNFVMANIFAASNFFPTIKLISVIAGIWNEAAAVL